MTIPPKFLICKSKLEPNREFVVHNLHPYFLAEVFVNVDGSKDILPILEYEPLKYSEIGINRLAALMREMGDWYVNETSS